MYLNPLMYIGRWLTPAKRQDAQIAFVGLSIMGAVWFILKQHFTGACIGSNALLSRIAYVWHEVGNSLSISNDH